MNLDLDNRKGWPDDLRILLDAYPRNVWPEHANLGDMARFWLHIHDQFRSLGRDLREMGEAFREGHMEATDYRAWYPRRLSQFLGGLEGHHSIEDYQFFPVFTAAEPRLAKGFEVLERDHETIHAAMVAAYDTGSALVATLDKDRDATMKAAEQHDAAGERLLGLLTHHLDDEEDLIIPLILDRGEGPLGLA
ncbi:MAG: hemerythrin domain-containing protein [Bauldia sp.]|nr:hemerythrin domain-containing protein [Bauldia sp.]